VFRFFVSFFPFFFLQTNSRLNRHFMLFTSDYCDLWAAANPTCPTYISLNVWGSG
jgi:hypothetical protein